MNGDCRCQQDPYGQPSEIVCKIQLLQDRREAFSAVPSIRFCKMPRANPNRMIPIVAAIFLFIGISFLAFGSFQKKI